MTTDNAPTTPAEAPHACSNCEGIDPDTCLVNPDRPRGDQDARHVTWREVKMEG